MPGVNFLKKYFTDEQLKVFRAIDDAVESGINFKEINMIVTPYETIIVTDEHKELYPRYCEVKKW